MRKFYPWDVVTVKTATGEHDNEGQTGTVRKINYAKHPEACVVQFDNGETSVIDLVDLVAQDAVA